MYNDIPSKEIKSGRIMELLFRALKGEQLSVRALADEYGVSSRSITRDINDLKAFMAERPETFFGSELVYSGSNHCYTLSMDTLLSNSEVLAIAKILIGCRVFSKKDIGAILVKLESCATPADRASLKGLLQAEFARYREPGADCESVITNLQRLCECIASHKLISIFYLRSDRDAQDYKLMPVSVMYNDGYFYLIAYIYTGAEREKLYREDGTTRAASRNPYYFRIDRIKSITIHRNTFTAGELKAFDEGYVRNRSPFMWPGPLRRVVFEFTGPSVQVILDKLPTAHILEHRKDGTYVVEAESYGDGIIMFLLSQGSWVRVLEPTELVDIIKKEIKKMQALY